MQTAPMNEGSTFQRVLPLQDAWEHANPILHLHMGSPNISHMSWSQHAEGHRNLGLESCRLQQV